MEYRRRGFERPRLNLVRGADGRLRPADEQKVVEDDDIVDIWADQTQIRQQTAEPPVQTYHIHQQEEPDPEPVPSAAPIVRAPKKRLYIPPQLPFRKLLAAVRPKYAAAAAIAVTVVVLSIISFNSLGQKVEVAQEQPSSPATNVLDATDTSAPTFDTLVPTGKRIEDLGGWVRVSPADKDPVFAYVDTVDSVQLNISQQQLPEALRTNTSQEVEKLAQGFAANEKIVAGGLTAYLGTSIKGPQSVIFVKDGLLVLIKSSGKLTNQQWADYIASLR